MLQRTLSVLLVSFFVAFTPAGIAVAGIDREATYQVSDPNVATVNATGLIYGVGEGTTTILIRYHDLEAQVTVTVLKVF